MTTAAPQSAAGIPVFAPAEAFATSRLSAEPAAGATRPLASNQRSTEPTAATGATQLPSIVHEVTRQSGRPLDNAVRSRLEPRLHADFSQVRIHTGEQASHAAAAINAQAYTVGRDVVFGAGEYQPGTDSGQHLLAHELTHVAQPQTSGGPALSTPGDASEREADSVADAVSQGRTAQALTTTPAASVQRQPLTTPDPPSTSDQPQSATPRPLSITDRLLDKASPFLAAATGSTVLEGFDTGKAEIKPAQRPQLASTANNIQLLLKQYPTATIHVIGHTDTVGAEEANLDLGQSRAAAVADALTKLGIPAERIESTTTGEAAPQAVKTRDETPNAKNRRVEIRFEPNAGPAVPNLSGNLEIKPPVPADDKPPPKPIDLTYHPHDSDQEPRNLPPDYWKPIPPAPKGSGPKSALDVIGEVIIDPVVDRVAHGLSKENRDRIKQAARSAVKSGVAKLARTAAEAAGLKDTQGLDAIEKAAEAAIEEKGNSHNPNPARAGSDKVGRPP